MRILTMTELMHITRPELAAWEARLVAALGDYAEGSPDHTAALTNLRNIRAVLARPDYANRARYFGHGIGCGL